MRRTRPHRWPCASASRSPTARIDAFLAELTSHPDIREAVVLSTCNRTELYLVVGDPVEAESAVLAMLARRAGHAARRS